MRTGNNLKTKNAKQVVGKITFSENEITSFLDEVQVEYNAETFSVRLTLPNQKTVLMVTKVEIENLIITRDITGLHIHSIDMQARALNKVEKKLRKGNNK